MLKVCNGFVDETVWIGGFKVLWEGISTDFIGWEQSLGFCQLIPACEGVQKAGNTLAHRRRRQNAEKRR